MRLSSLLAWPITSQNQEGHEGNMVRRAWVWHVKSVWDASKTRQRHKSLTYMRLLTPLENNLQQKNSNRSPQNVFITGVESSVLHYRSLQVPVGMMMRHHYQNTKSKSFLLAHSCCVSLSSPNIARVPRKKVRRNAGMQFWHHGPVSTYLKHHPK